MAPLARKAQARCLILDEVAATSDTFSSGSATLQQPLPDTGKRSVTGLSSLSCLPSPIREAVLIECAATCSRRCGECMQLPDAGACSAMQVIAVDIFDKCFVL